MPVRLTIDGPGVHIKRRFSPEPLKPYTDPVTGFETLAPPEATHEDLMRVYLQDAPKMNLPGNPAKGTVFVSGHTCRTCEAAFNNLQKLDGLKPSRVTARLELPNGKKLVYRLTQTDSIPNDDVPYRLDLYDYDDPKGLRILTCTLRSDGAPQDHQFVTWWTLVGVEL